MRLKKITSIIMIAAAVTLTGCSTIAKEAFEEKEPVEAGRHMDTSFPITIPHAFGETVIESKPERVAAIGWGNQDVALALSVAPVGVSQANYGVLEGESLLPWTKDKFNALGTESPNVFKDTDGIDFEAISDTQPDVILAAYSGLTQEEYDLLSQIAPVVAYPGAAWQTLWREQILLNAAGMGMQTEGESLVDDLETLIQEKTAQYPQLKGKTAAFFYFNPSDLGKFYVYLPTDPRAAYLTDFGLAFPESVSALGEDAGSFTVELSAENADILNDVDIMVAYGNEDLLEALQRDSLLRKIPAIENGAVALIEDGTPLAASGTPSALSIPETIDDYLKILGKSAKNVP